MIPRHTSKPDTKGPQVKDSISLAHRLVELLGLTDPAVAVTFDALPSTETSSSVPAEPAGCCFWAPAQQRRLDTVASDHAHCSVGSYTHGLIPLETAAAGDDTAALVGSGWVGEADLLATATLPMCPRTITYQPLTDAADPDVILIRLSPSGLMTLLGAVPELALARKPQCVIVPLAYAGQVAVSPGCAVSRTRTKLPSDDLTCAIPARDLGPLLAKLEIATAADRAVSEFAADDIARNFTYA